MGLKSGGRSKTGNLNAKRAQRGATQNRFCPRLEALEDRVVPTTLTVGPNINVSQTPGDQAEAAITVDPVNPNLMVAASNDLNSTTTLNRIYTSSDGGLTWTGRLITNGDITGSQGVGDPTVVFDQFGNLFFTYLDTEDGGATFQI